MAPLAPTQKCFRTKTKVNIEFRKWILSARLTAQPLLVYKSNGKNTVTCSSLIGCLGFAHLLESRSACTSMSYTVAQQFSVD